MAERTGSFSSAWLVALLLSGCGGGVFFGFGSGFDDFAPSVSLTTAATSVRAGQAVRFAAAASDENGIDHVAFFRVDSGGAVLLANDASEPYELSVIAPDDGRSSLQVFARATDNSGQTADSATISVAITP